MPRSLAKKQIACPANTLLEATGAHILLQTQSYPPSITQTPLNLPYLVTTAKNGPYAHRHTTLCLGKIPAMQCKIWTCSSVFTCIFFGFQVLICMFYILKWEWSMSYVIFTIGETLQSLQLVLSFLKSIKTLVWVGQDHQKVNKYTITLCSLYHFITPAVSGLPSPGSSLRFPRQCIC